MRIVQRRWSLLGGLLCSALLCFSVAANANAGTITAPDPAATLTSVTVTERYGALTLTPQQKSRLGLTAAATTAGGCWYYYSYKDWYDLGINDGSTWMQLNWCASATAITKYFVSNVGGASNALGYSGYRGPYWRMVNNSHEIRSLIVFTFNSGPFSLSPCMQLRGTYTAQVFDMGNNCSLA